MAHVELWVAERSLSLGLEILNRENADLVISRGGDPDVFEAAHSLE